MKSLIKACYLLLVILGTSQMLLAQSPIPAPTPYLLSPHFFGGRDSEFFVFTKPGDRAVIIFDCDTDYHYFIRHIAYRACSQAIIESRATNGSYDTIEITRKPVTAGRYSVQNSDFYLIADKSSGIREIKLPRTGRNMKINGKWYRARGQVVRIR